MSVVKANMEHLLLCSKTKLVLIKCVRVTVKDAAILDRHFNACLILCNMVHSILMLSREPRPSLISFTCPDSFSQTLVVLNNIVLSNLQEVAHLIFTPAL